MEIGAKRLVRELLKQTLFCVRLVALCWQKLSNIAKLLVIGLCFDPHLWSWTLSKIWNKTISYERNGDKIFAEFTAWQFVIKCAAVTFVPPWVSSYVFSSSRDHSLGHVFKMSNKILARKVLLKDWWGKPTPTGKWSRCRSRTNWRYYVSDLAWSLIDVVPNYLILLLIVRCFEFS